MEEQTVTLTAMAHGGAALGRDENNRVIFVPLAIPGERVRVEIVEDKKRYANGRLLELVEASPDRVDASCPHFGPCGGCHWQHIAYPAQLRLKTAVVKDQLARIGRLENAPVKEILPNPQPYHYAVHTHLLPAPDGGLGYWSPALGRVMPIETCHILHRQLDDLLPDLDLDLPELRRLALWVGDDEALLAAIAVDGDEPPELEVDFPISAALLLPDGTAVNLVGDNFTIQRVKERDFRVSPGCFFYPSPPAAALLVEQVQAYAGLSGSERVVELYSGVGLLTACLAGQAAEITGLEPNPDAVADAAVNLDEFDNITLYEGIIEEILPHLALSPDLMIAAPPDAGLSLELVETIVHSAPQRLIYVACDVATLARDGRQLATAGYRLVELQPIDMFPQTFQTLTVSLWKSNRSAPLDF